MHLQFFKSIDEIAAAKAELIQGLHDPKVAFLNNDADGMQREMKWAEGKPSEYSLLNEAAAVGAARG